VNCDSQYTEVVTCVGKICCEPTPATISFVLTHVNYYHIPQKNTACPAWIEFTLVYIRH